MHWQRSLNKTINTLRELRERDNARFHYKTEKMKFVPFLPQWLTNGYNSITLDIHNSIQYFQNDCKHNWAADVGIYVWVTLLFPALTLAQQTTYGVSSWQRNSEYGWQLNHYEGRRTTACSIISIKQNQWVIEMKNILWNFFLVPETTWEKDGSSLLPVLGELRLKVLDLDAPTQGNRL